MNNQRQKPPNLYTRPSGPDPNRNEAQNNRVTKRGRKKRTLNTEEDEEQRPARRTHLEVPASNAGPAPLMLPNAGPVPPNADPALPIAGPVSPAPSNSKSNAAPTELSKDELPIEGSEVIFFFFSWIFNAHLEQVLTFDNDHLTLARRDGDGEAYTHAVSII